MSFDFRVVLLLPLLVAVIEGKSCEKKFQVHDRHSACLKPAAGHKSGGVISGTDRQHILDSHNRVRREVDPPAKNMQQMVWDDELASVAQGWASQCSYTHEDPLRRRIPGKYQVGQNLGRESNVGTLMITWEAEKTDFNFDGDPVPNDFNKTGRYAQMIWAKSAKVGCAYADCDSIGQLYVCNYAPKMGSDLGNPYNEGDVDESCEECPDNCNSKLCDCGGKVCENSAAIDLQTCKCTCTHLNPYSTDTCSLNCTAITEDVSGQCDLGKCSDEGVPSACPYKCNDCPYAGVDYNGSEAMAQLSLVLLLMTTAAVLALANLL